MADNGALSTPTKRMRGIQPNESPKSSPASSKKAKFSKLPKTPRTAGRADDTTTHSSGIWQFEGEMAGYLGYSDIADLRRFAVCPITLHFYNSLKDDIVKMQLDKVLELIRDRRVNVLSDEDPQNKYPREHSGKMNCRVALIIAQARRAIEKAQSKSITWTQDEVERECAEFEALANVECPRLQASEFRPVFPKLGPFDHLDENDLQAYSRVFSLIKYLEFSTKSPWKGRFGSKKWDRSLLVAASHVPDWMRPKSSPVVEASKSATEAAVSPIDGAPARQALSVTIRWNYNARLAEAAEFREYIEEEDPDGVRGVPKEQVLKIEPAARREHILNSIREMFRLQQLNAQIETLLLELVDPNLPEDDEVGDPTFPVLTTLWSDIREALWSGKYNLTKSSFSMTVRIAPEGEIIFDKVTPLGL